MKIQFKDINGTVLNTGDWLEIANTRNNTGGGMHLLTFYAQLKILPKGGIQPFDNFCFNQIRKINFADIPADKKKWQEEEYFVVYKGALAEDKEKRDAYILSKLDFDSNRQFYTITADE